MSVGFMVGIGSRKSDKFSRNEILRISWNFGEIYHIVYGGSRPPLKF